MKTRVIFMVICFSLFISKSVAQDWGDRDYNFIIARAGIGIPYSFYGLNFEYGKNFLSAYASAGYQNSHQFKDINIPKSLNFGIGGRVYFEKETNTSLRPNLGLHMGWLANHYRFYESDSLMKQNVYGAVLTFVYEYYMENLHIEGGVVFSPPFMTFNTKNSNTLYDGNRFFLHPVISVGVNLAVFSSSKSKSKKKVKKADKKFQQTILKYYLPKTQKDNTKIKGVCGNITIYKQIYSKKYLVIKINPDSIRLSYNNTIYEIDSSNKNIKIYLMDINQIDKDICCSINLFDSLLNCETHNAKLYKGIRGTISIAINREILYSKSIAPYEIIVKLDDLKFARICSDQKEKLYFSDIVIWRLVNKIFCE